MRPTPLIVLLCVFWSITASAQAFKFKSFKITDKFKKILDRGPSVPDIMGAKSNGFSTAANDSKLEQEIAGYLSPRYESIGKNQITDIFNYNRNFDMGSYNFSGFTWQKPMGYFQIKVNRSLAPDLFDQDRWIVTDTMVIEVEAQTYLEKLVDEGLVEISQSTLNAFAGIIFKRTYRYQHIADSFENGLKSDLSKLFLGFTILSPKNITKMKDYEFLERQDLLSFKAGASAGIPLGYGFEVRGGALLKFDRVSSLSVQSVGSEDGDRKENERYRINSRLENITSTGVTASLQVDFFNLIKLHLISYEFTHELTKSKATHLSLSEKQLTKVVSEPSTRSELRALMLLSRAKVEQLADYVVSYEYRRKQNLNSKYSVFHFEGSLKKGNQTFQFFDREESKVKNFHRYTYSNDKVLQTFWGKLINGVLASLLNFELFRSIKAAKYDRMVLEYDSEKGISIDSDLAIDDESKLSIKLEKELFVKKYGWPLKKNLHRRVTNFGKHFTTLNNDILSSLESQNMHPPLRLKTSITLMKNAFVYFHAQSESQIFKGIANLCRSKRVDRWVNTASRQRALKAVGLNRRENCVRNLGKKYLSYRKTFEEKKRIDLKKLNQITREILKKVGLLSDLDTFFGRQNMFVDGVLQATVSGSIPFTHYYRIGEFQGNGIIDKYVREQGLSSKKGRH